MRRSLNGSNGDTHMTVPMSEADGRPRCTEPGCFVRYRTGADRPCPMHQEDGDTLTARMEAMTAVMGAPGEWMADTDGTDGTDGRQ